MTLELKFNESFNWLAILKDLASGQQLNDHQLFDLLILAREWETCVCGQLCKELPKRDDCACPADPILGNLGCQFVGQIRVFDWRGAIETFYEVEARTALLLKLKPLDVVELCPDCSTKLMSYERGTTCTALVCPNSKCNYVLSG